MNRHPDFTRSRITHTAGVMFGKIYSESRPVDELLVSPGVDRISFAAAEKLKYAPAKVGQQFGPLWSTFWFKVKALVPKTWKGRRVDLLWDAHSEATLWIDGRVKQGLNNDGGWIRPDATLTPKAHGGETLECRLEMACNRLFGSAGNEIKSISPFVLDRCDIAVFDPLAWELYHDFWALQELEADSGKEMDKSWAGELLAKLNMVVLLYRPDERDTWAPALSILKELYCRRNASTVHEVSAVGHAHIDTAWLWPLAETRRKCERTFSSQIALMDLYPEYKFACSQAAQYAMMEEANPDLYNRIKAKVTAGQFLPVGGTWVEPDCNLPSGEALARQFLYGQRYFQQKFGITCREFWNPDVFGYNGQLPQLMRLSGMTRFLTQKLSWNSFNKPIHQTFNWQGIDGSEVLAHFPPSNNYNSDARIADLRAAARDYKDHDRSRHSYLLFGFGDGGGGPTKRMIEGLLRAKDLEGVPRTRIRSSTEFFELLENDCTDRITIIGELYFEYHRGTYTTQALTKKNNRKNEFLLHDVEFLAACAHRLGTATYPCTALDRVWKLLLLNQFHDILPGSSITLVYEDTTRDHEEIRKTGETLRDQALKALAGGRAQAALPVNTIGFERCEVAPRPDGTLAFVVAPSYGIGAVASAPDKVTLTRKTQRIILENAWLRAELASDGSVVSLIEKQTGRETLTAPGNVLELYEDVPGDAWDVHPPHLETGQPCLPASSCKIVTRDPLRAEVAFERKIGLKSRATQVVRLDAGARRLEFHTEIDWQESLKMLKVAFPINARAMNATYEMQFGCVERPTHYNTSFDLARYEVPGHKWADLGEHGFGAALLTDCKYGYSTFGNVMRISLLRAPKWPDPVADMGKHTFSYAILPHAGGWREAGVVAEAYRFNVPLLWANGRAAPQSFFSVNDANLVLDTVKKAEDSDALVLRFYEAHGARGTARVKCALPFKSAVFCNILEEDGAKAKVGGDEIEVPYTPYQIISVKLK